MDLTEFLAARLDEREQAAYLLAGTEWTAVGADVYVRTDPLPEEPIASACRGDVAQWIALHSPRSAQREVEAGRKLLAWYAATGDRAYLNAIQARAAVYSDHPDYDPLWAPPE